MAEPHNKIISAAARQVLGPLGFRRKGRSRVWLKDHHWWAIVVEFEPSSWSKGSGLNVAAHWLWSAEDHISFDFGLQSEGFEEYVSDDQFSHAAQRLALAGVEEAEQLDRTFPSIEATADVLINHEVSLGPGPGGWSAYDAGVAAGLAGRTSDAESMFQSVTEERVRGAVERLLPLLPNAVRFRSEVTELMRRHRSAIRLADLGQL